MLYFVKKLTNIFVNKQAFVVYNIVGSDNMSILSNMLLKEDNRNKNMIYEYYQELNTLPRGSVTPKNVKGKVYYYLTYREKNKIITKYIGKDEKDLENLKEKLLRRKQIEEILKKLKEERLKIKKLEAIL